MGLALAEGLASQDHEVTVYESAAQVGGLSTWKDYGAFVWDRFYHVILPSDRSLIAFLGRLGLSDKLNWRPSGTGYFVGREMYSLTTGLDFIRFPLLGPISKLRLAITILYCARIKDWRRLEGLTVEEFLVRTSGRDGFTRFWEPLLRAKLGESYHRVSAVFIWTYIRRLFSARDATAQREHLGYVSGGYRTVFQRLTERIASLGGRVHTGVEVREVRPRDGGIEVVVDGVVRPYDKVIFTGPVSVMRAIVDKRLVDVPAAGDIEYLGVVCVVLVTRNPLVPFYVVNIADDEVSFTGAIGMSSLVDVAETGGRYLTYLPKYVLSTDPLLSAPDEDVRAMFTKGLRKMFPSLDEVGVEAVHVHRAFKVQPLQVVGYSARVVAPRTLNPHFFVVNSGQFVSSTLNNNEVIRAVDVFLANHEIELRDSGIERRTA